MISQDTGYFFRGLLSIGRVRNVKDGHSAEIESALEIDCREVLS
jgi:hypothetical protein